MGYFGSRFEQKTRKVDGSGHSKKKRKSTDWWFVYPFSPSTQNYSTIHSHNFLIKSSIFSLCTVPFHSSFSRPYHTRIYRFPIHHDKCNKISFPQLKLRNIFDIIHMEFMEINMNWRKKPAAVQIWKLYSTLKVQHWSVELGK